MTHQSFLHLPNGLTQTANPKPPDCLLPVAC